ncbi:MAG: hypothetical protein LAN64_14925 [Acidobacteriia bacterium]|nr:hypothetical protein [Terriglobia bacterium]
MLATLGALLTQANTTPVSVFPFESCAVAENACARLGEMDADLGVTLIVVGGLELDEDPPPQPESQKPINNNPPNTPARLPLLCSNFSRMIN